MPRSVTEEAVPSLLASLATAGMQFMPFISEIPGWYPDRLQTMMIPLSALVVGCTVYTTLATWADSERDRLKRKIDAALALTFVMILVLVVLTLSLVVHYGPPTDPESAVVGILGRLQDCECGSSVSDAACASGLAGQVALCWGQWQVRVSEVLIVITYLAMALSLGRLGGLLWRYQRSSP